MQINSIIGSSEQSEARHMELTRKLRVLMARIQALEMLVPVNEDGDDEKQAAGMLTQDTALLRLGLRELEQMAGEILYDVQETNDGLHLADLPGVSLSEAFSQLIDTTAEKLSLSSRVAFSGGERPLSDYLARLLYRIAQEALARVSTHEGARRLRFSLDYRRAEVVMMIEDDGVPHNEEQFLHEERDETATLLPFLATQPPESQNTQQTNQIWRRLHTMVADAGGSLLFNSGIEQGVQIQVRLPLHNTKHEAHIHPHPQSEPASIAGQKTAETPSRVKVLIVDGQTVSRAGLRRLLESYADLEIVGEAGDSVQAVSEAAELLPHIILLDAQLPENQSLETLRQLRQLNRDTHVLLLANNEDETLFYEALRAGAGGYILKDIVPDELAQAVRSVARGDILLQPQLAARLLTRSARAEHAGEPLQEGLTVREREVLQLLARGLRNKEIAARLFVSERTVNFHLANIYAKLHVSGRTEALSKALERGLLKV